MKDGLIVQNESMNVKVVLFQEGKVLAAFDDGTAACTLATLNFEQYLMLVSKVNLILGLLCLFWVGSLPNAF